MPNAWEKAKVVQPAPPTGGNSPAWATAKVVSSAPQKRGKRPSVLDDYKGGIKESMDAFTEQQNRVEARRSRNERTNNFGGRITDALRYPADQALTALTAIGAATSPVFSAPIKAGSRPYSDLMYDTGVEFRLNNLGQPQLGMLSLIPTIEPIKRKSAEGREANRQVTEAMMTAGSMAVGGFGGGAGKAGTVAREAAPMVNMFGKAGEAAKAESTALRMAAKDLKKAGSKAADAMARNPDLSFAEAVGERGMKRVRRLGEMDDLGLRDNVTGAMADRISSTPARINRAAEKRTGIVPEAAEANIDVATVRGQKAAQPLYDEAYQQTVDSPVLRGLLQRPGVQEAMRPATKGILNQGRSPYDINETLALPDSLPTGTPTGDAAAYLDDVQALATGGVRRANRAAASLSDTLAEMGGIADKTGDLAAFDADRMLFNPGVGKLKKLTRDGGMSLDDAAVRAWEAGYFRDVPTQRELLDALRNEARGKPMRSMQAEGDPTRGQYLEGLDQRIGELGVPGGSAPRKTAQALADDDAALRNLEDFAAGRQSGLSPVAIEEKVPTMERLDKTKRYLDDAVRDARARGKNETASDLDAARSDLVGELRNLNPTYAKALDTASDYLRNKAAFDASSRQFSGASGNAYRQYVAGLSGPEKEANLAGLLADFDKRMSARVGGPKAFLDTLNAPAVREKLAIAAEHLGPEVGAKLHRDILNAIEVRNNASRMMPRASRGSTRDIENDLLAEATGANGSKLPTSRAGMVSSLVDMVANPARQVWYKTRMAKGKPTLEAYARLMLERGDITMAQIQAMPDNRLKTILLRIGKTIAPVAGRVAAGSGATNMFGRLFGGTQQQQPQENQFMRPVGRNVGKLTPATAIKDAGGNWRRPDEM
ncbi:MULTISPECIES: hypothetical protein [Asticcacaulis]|uniref:hypothetical protein n=1 Tax=Asticcacaulis TaxID=76890 RepID=UPI001AEAF12C|nr:MULTISPECIES: hypothetical protein [Asticcacaulis]MBP2159550.1 hypothetical protein [Asticcacaulis solisilvae]MDR6800623.1 hypothetical protein [Asticcacaulis sp. BE141]